MTPSSPSPLPEKKSDKPPCKHPRVQIVAREEDSEFVECKECGEIFESSEFKDMIIEDDEASQGILNLASAGVPPAVARALPSPLT